MIRHDIAWTEPAPLWTGTTLAVTPGMRAGRPRILRFTSDSFMEEFTNLLATVPQRLGEYAAQPETWQGFAAPPKCEKPARLSALERLGFPLNQRRASTLPMAPGLAPEPLAQPLKLYQPAHQRYYLVVSSLVCERAGLPDRQIDAGRQERVGFVLRRLWPAAEADPNQPLGRPDDTWQEHAFVQQADSSFAWSPVTETAQGGRPLAQAGEERLPLFPASCPNHCHRRLLAGLIPVARRETYMGAPKATGIESPTAGRRANPPGTTEVTARKVLFRTKVSEPWKALVDRAVAFNQMQNPEPEGEYDEAVSPTPGQLRALREQVQTVSWLILADFRQFLEDYVSEVWQRVAAGDPGELGGSKRSLYDALQNTELSEGLIQQLQNEAGTPASSLADALKQLTAEVVEKMDRSEAAYLRDGPNPNWPAFLFPLVDAEDIATTLQPELGQGVSLDNQEIDELRDNVEPASTLAELGDVFKQQGDVLKRQIDRFAALVLRSMDETPKRGSPAVPLAAVRPADVREGWFRIRCVYERSQCDPAVYDVVSDPTEPFQLAGFFDPDAPARPVRIGLPLDTTPSGLRKFDRNTAFMISDVLCGQIKRLKGLTLGDLVRSVLPWPLHKDLSVPDAGPCTSGGLNAGMICSLSIPIITICALILLLIMVTLLDYVFRWLPYFVICFPIKGLCAKNR